MGRNSGILKLEVRELVSEQPVSLGFCEFQAIPARGDYVEIMRGMFPTYLYQVAKIEHVPVHEDFRQLQVGKDQVPTAIVYVDNGVVLDL